MCVRAGAQLASSILPSPEDGLAHNQDGSSHIILSGVHQDSQVLRWGTDRLTRD